MVAIYRYVRYTYGINDTYLNLGEILYTHIYKTHIVQIIFNKYILNNNSTSKLLILLL